MRRQKQNKVKIIVGLTGGFGSGKTTIARLFRGLGASIIDADKIAHKYLRAGSPVYNKIKHSFGSKVVTKNGAISRKELAKVVFSDKYKLRKLNGIIHPGVIRDIKSEIASLKSRVIILDAPLLVEAGLTGIVDIIIVVKVPEALQVNRAQNRFFLSRIDILKRIKCQLPLSKKESLADFIIDNSGSIDKTKKQVSKIWRKLQPRLRGYKGGCCGKVGYR